MVKIKVKFKKLSPQAVIPAKAHPGDFCYDCVAVSEEQIAPNIWKYGLGFALQIERPLDSPVLDRFPGSLAFDLRPRSSVWKTGMVLSNCVGTVDENYTGEISAVFYHVLPGMPRYRVGDRVAQLKLGDALDLVFNETDDLEDTDRGSGGYGSTGR